MKDLKTSIYRILTCSVLVLSLFSCEAEFDLPTYPTLSGTYEVSWVRAMGQNLTTGVEIDTTYYTGQFSMANPIGPFDVLDIGEKIHFTYAKVYGGHYLNGNGGQDWVYDYNYNVLQDVVNREYTKIDIPMYGVQTPNGDCNPCTRRVYNIIQDGVDYLILSNSGQWESVSPEGTFTKHTFRLERVGP